MKTTIEFNDGLVEVTEDAAPSVDPQSGTVTLIDKDCGVIEEIPTSVVKRVVFDL